MVAVKTVGVMALKPKEKNDPNRQAERWWFRRGSNAQNGCGVNGSKVELFW